jgi:hypothetical protein
VEAVVMKALARAPGDRFETAAALSKALTEALRAPRETAPVETREAPPMETIVRRPTDRTPITPPTAPSPVQQTALAPPVEQTAQAPTMATVVKPPTAAPLVSAPTSVTVVKPASGPIAKPPTTGGLVSVASTRDAAVRRRKSIVYVNIALAIAVLAATAYLLLRPDSYEVTTIAPPPGCKFGGNVDMSTDGRYIAVAASCQSGDVLHTQVILTDRVAGTSQVITTPFEESFSMTPDGRYVFTWGIVPGPSAQLVRYDRVSAQSVVINDTIGSLPPRPLSVSDDGRYIATGGISSAQGSGAYVLDVQSGVATRLAACECFTTVSPDGQWLGRVDGATMHVANRVSGRAWQRKFPQNIGRWQFGRARTQGPQDEPVVYLTAGSTFYRYHPTSEQALEINSLYGMTNFHVASDSLAILFGGRDMRDDFFQLFLNDFEKEWIVAIARFPLPSDALKDPVEIAGATNHAVALSSGNSSEKTLYAIDR